MKLITAIIKPFKLDDVRQAVADVGVQGVTVTRFADSAATRPYGNLSRREYVVESCRRQK